MVECAKSVRAAITEQSDVEVVYGRICKEVEARMASFQDAPSDLSLKLNKILVEPTRPIQIFLLFLVQRGYFWRPSAKNKAVVINKNSDFSKNCFQFYSCNSDFWAQVPVQQNLRTQHAPRISFLLNVTHTCLLVKIFRPIQNFYLYQCLKVLQ